MFQQEAIGVKEVATSIRIISPMIDLLLVIEKIIPLVFANSLGALRPVVPLGLYLAFFMCYLLTGLGVLPELNFGTSGLLN